MFSQNGAAIIIAASNASANATLTVPGTGQSCTLKVVNPTTAVCYVKLSATSSPTATSADIAIPAGWAEYIPLPSNFLYAAVLLGAATTGNVSLATGVGEPGNNV